MRLTAIHNELKQTISASGGVGLLEIRLDPNLKKRVTRDMGRVDIETKNKVTIGFYFYGSRFNLACGCGGD